MEDRILDEYLDGTLTLASASIKKISTLDKVKYAVGT